MLDQGLEPDVVSYSSVSAACAKRSNADMAAKQLQRMLNQGLKPDVVRFVATCHSPSFRPMQKAKKRKAGSGTRLLCIFVQSVDGASAEDKEDDNMSKAKQSKAKQSKANVVIEPEVTDVIEVGFHPGEPIPAFVPPDSMILTKGWKRPCIHRGGRCGPRRQHEEKSQ